MDVRLRVALDPVAQPPVPLLFLYEETFDHLIIGMCGLLQDLDVRAGDSVQLAPGAISLDVTAW